MPPTRFAVHVTPSGKSDTLFKLRSITAEYLRRISQPTKMSNGNPVAIKNAMSKAISRLTTLTETCFLMVLFWRPVAPTNTMLLTGNIGKVLPHVLCILSNSLEFIIEILAPVSIIILAGTPSTSAAVSYTHLDVYKRQAYTSWVRKG